MTSSRNPSGYTEPHDCENRIPDESFILRSIPKIHLKDAENGMRRLSKGAFSGSSEKRDPTMGMSSSGQAMMKEDDIPNDEALKPGHGALVRLPVGELRRLGLQVGVDRNDDNPYHVQVWGIKKNHRTKILRLAEWVIRPDDAIEEIT
jgi:hypothetical protein